MIRFLILPVFLLWSSWAMALSPYLYGSQVRGGGDLGSAMAQVEARLAKAGFDVIGRHTPPGLPGYGVVVVTDKLFLNALRGLGGSNIVGAAIRVGVKADGTVSYMNPEYWYRAYFRNQFSRMSKTVASLQQRLAKALGKGKPFGGDVAASDLPDYQYMFGMESFDTDKNLLMERLDFDDAVKTVQENLAKGVGKTAKVYEVILPEQKIAVFGVAFNDPSEGEGWWLKTVGPNNIAAMPYEIFVVNNRVMHLFARYRIALSWPEVGMGTFMRIVEAPGIIRDTLIRVAGGSPG